MKISVGLLTHNVFKYDRFHTFAWSLESLLREPGNIKVHILDNGSTDGTQDLVKMLGGDSRTGRTTTGAGKNELIRRTLKDKPDLVVLSDDDIYWKPNWSNRLDRFWGSIPDDVVLTGAVLEKEYAWNEIYGVLESGGERYLSRASTSGSSWSFLASNSDYIGMMPSKVQAISDIPVCERIIDDGYVIAQLDLAYDYGLDKSAWGNLGHKLGEEFDYEKWGFDVQ